MGLLYLKNEEKQLYSAYGLTALIPSLDDSIVYARLYFLVLSKSLSVGV